MSLEELTIKVAQESLVRNTRLQAMSKIDTSSSRVSIPGLTEAEKAMIKSLGLSLKDIKILQGGLG
jgi:hypothetical protein